MCRRNLRTHVVNYSIAVTISQQGDETHQGCPRGRAAVSSSATTALSRRPLAVTGILAGCRSTPPTRPPLILRPWARGWGKPTPGCWRGCAVTRHLLDNEDERSPVATAASAPVSGCVRRRGRAVGRWRPGRRRRRRRRCRPRRPRPRPRRRARWCGR